MKKYIVYCSNMDMAYNYCKEAYAELEQIYQKGEIDIPIFAWKRCNNGYRLEIKRLLYIDYVDIQILGASLGRNDYKEIKNWKEAFETPAPQE